MLRIGGFIPMSRLPGRATANLRRLSSIMPPAAEKPRWHASAAKTRFGLGAGCGPVNHPRFARPLAELTPYWGPRNPPARPDLHRPAGPPTRAQYLAAAPPLGDPPC